ncbi:unknown [Bacteroides sp. CAG:1060]|nr:unknown [Bacteroides sp. CAG:1060]
MALICLPTLFCKQRELLMHRSSEFIIDLVLLLERNMTYSLPFLVERTHLGRIRRIVFRALICSHFLDKPLLGLKVAVIVVLTTGIRIPVGKELVTSGTETLPELLGFLARYGTYFFPLLLESYQLVRCLFPLGTALESLCLLDNGLLFLKICSHTVLYGSIMLPLSFEELVASGAETVINLLILLLGGKSYGTPFRLKRFYLFRELIPVSGILDFALGYFFQFLAKDLLFLKILLLLSLQAFEMSLILLVDHRSGSLESVPDLFTLFFGYRTILLPLLVQFLKFMERVYHILVLGKLFRCSAKSLFSLKILLEIQITKIPIDLYHVIELLDIVLIRIIDVAIRLYRYRAGLPPTILKFAERRKLRTYILLSFHQSLQLFYYGFFLFETLFPFGFKTAHVFCPFSLIVGINSLEILLYHFEWIILGTAFAVTFTLKLGKQLIESRLDGFQLL